MGGLNINICSSYHLGLTMDRDSKELLNCGSLKGEGLLLAYGMNEDLVIRPQPSNINCTGNQ